jgi:hypothetical protein
MFCLGDLIINYWLDALMGESRGRFDVPILQGIEKENI